jgi:hypothetical protein
VAVPDGALAPVVHGKFSLSQTGLTWTGTPSFDEWREVGHVLCVMERGIQFLVGDWMRCGEQLYGELAAQVVDQRHWSLSTARNYTWVAEKVPPDVRHPALSFRHHQLVAKLPPRQQKSWLAKAAGDGDGTWPVAQLKAAIKDGGEAPETSWWLVVRCATAADQEALRTELERRGHECAAQARHGRRKGDA